MYIYMSNMRTYITDDKLYPAKNYVKEPFPMLLYNFYRFIHFLSQGFIHFFLEIRKMDENSTLLIFIHGTCLRPLIHHDTPTSQHLLLKYHVLYLLFPLCYTLQPL